MDQRLTTTGFELVGYRIVENLGVVRGVTVRSRGIGGQMAAALRTLGGGTIHEYVEMCEEARGEAFDLMIRHAEALKANAIVGVRYDATELGTNMTEVLAYGTAVVVEMV
ncbi:MAG: YbjQ family protein [Chloroflexota bacterium]